MSAYKSVAEILDQINPSDYEILLEELKRRISYNDITSVYLDVLNNFFSGKYESVDKVGTGYKDNDEKIIIIEQNANFDKNLIKKDEELIRKLAPSTFSKFEFRSLQN